MPFVLWPRLMLEIPWTFWVLMCGGVNEQPIHAHAD
jgi:hypothetical protein